MGNIIDFDTGRRATFEPPVETLPDDIRALVNLADGIDQACALAFGLDPNDASLPSFLETQGINDPSELIGDPLKRAILEYGMLPFEALLDAAAPFLDDPERQQTMTDADRILLKATIPVFEIPLAENEIPFHPDPEYRDVIRDIAAIRRETIREISEASAELRRQVDTMLEGKPRGGFNSDPPEHS